MFRKEIGMKYGCCLNMVASTPNKTGVEWIETLAKSGFNYAELPLSEMIELPESDFLRVIDSLKQNNITCELL